jgi:uncharacterized protein (TIGR02145 family)
LYILFLVHNENGKVMKSNNNIPVSITLTLLCAVLIFTQCKKNEVTTSSNPTVNTTAASLIGQNWATIAGSIYAAGGTYKIAFIYDTTTAYRFSAIADPDTATGSQSTTVNSNLTRLKAGTTYYYKVVAVTSADTTFGAGETFITTSPGKSTISFNSELTYGSVTDIDNNVYKTILIGTQTWMAENLKTTRFNDGTDISFTPDATKWLALTVPGYCWYNNDSIVYGGLYNWQAASKSTICPAGWHVPTDEEWTILSNYVGGENVAGDKLKETGTTHWSATTSNISNEAGFTALPGGYRFAEGAYGNIRRYGFWWSSTESSTTQAFCMNIISTDSNFNLTSSTKNSGFSVRCLKD